MPFTHLRTAMLVMAVLNGTRIASAQDLRTYVGGVFAIASWNVESVSEGTPNLSFGNTSDANSTVCVGGEVGRYLTSHLAVGAEIGQTFRQGLTQIHGYIFDPYSLVSSYRDLTLFGVVRYEMGVGRTRIALVGGGGPVLGSSLQKTARGVFGPAGLAFGPFGDQREVTQGSVGATGGVDLIIQATRHIAVVPQFRVLGIGRGSVTSGSAFASFGLGSFSYRGGIGVRAAF